MLNKEIFKMSSFTPYNRRVDTELGEIQNMLVKTTALVAQLADSVLLADKKSRLMPAGDIISPILEAVMLMGHAHNKLTSKRRSNIKSTLHKDILRTVCDVTKLGEHLFGEDWGKAGKDARQDAQVAKVCENKDSIFVGTWSNLERPSNERNYKRPYRNDRVHNQKPFLAKGRQPQKPPNSTPSKKKFNK